jgi:hypothetical protein
MDTVEAHNPTQNDANYSDVLSLHGSNVRFEALRVVIIVRRLVVGQKERNASIFRDEE